MNKKLIVVGVVCLLMLPVAFGAELPAPVSPSQQLIAIDAQLKILMAGRMTSPAVQEAMARMREIERTREATVTAIPEVKRLDAQMKQLGDKLREMQQARAALVEQAQGSALADLDRQATEAREVVSGMSDPAIRALAQQRIQLMYAVLSATNLLVNATTK